MAMSKAERQLAELEANIDNLLVAQKNKLRDMILSRKYDEAKIILNFLKGCWEKMDYGYKYKELMQLIKDEQR